MSTKRHDITITRENGVHGLLIDGQKLLHGIRSVTVTNDVRNLPIVHIELIPASVHADLTITPTTES